MPLKYVAVLLLFTSSCSTFHWICPRYNPHPFGFGKDWIAGADVIVAGKILSYKPVRNLSWGNENRLLTLYEVLFEPYHVLKGALNGRTRFYIYLDSSKLPRSMRPAFDLTPHRTSIFFFREEDGTLRPLEDVLDYRLGLAEDPRPELPVTHSEYGTSHYVSDLSAADTQAAFGIARLLLAPPRENPERFKSNLANNVGIAEIATSARYTVELLRDLLSAPGANVAAAACFALADFYDGQSECLDTIPNLPPDRLWRAKERESEGGSSIACARSEPNAGFGQPCTDTRPA